MVLETYVMSNAQANMLKNKSLREPYIIAVKSGRFDVVMLSDMNNLLFSFKVPRVYVVFLPGKASENVSGICVQQSRAMRR